MNTAMRASIVITSDASGVRAGVRDAKGAIQELGQDAQRTAASTGSAAGGVRGLGRAGTDAAQGIGAVSRESRSLSAILPSLSRLAVQAGGALAAAFTLRQIVSVNAEFQRLGASLKTITGSAEAAKAQMAELRRFAAETPSSLREVTEAWTRLRAMGISASQDTLRAYGDMASGMGKPLMQMVEAVADATTGEFERLKEFGIRASTEGDRVRFTFKGITTEVGKNTAEIEAYLQQIAKANFGGAMAEQMNTIGGAFSNLGDAVDALFVRIGEGGLNDLIIGGARLAAEAISFLTENIEYLGIGLAALGAGAIAANLGTLFTLLQTGLAATVGGIRAVGLAIAANPLGLLIMGLTAAGAWLVTFRDEIHPVAGSVATLGDYFRAAGEIIGEVVDWIGAKWSGFTNWFTGLVDQLGQNFGTNWTEIWAFTTSLLADSVNLMINGLTAIPRTVIIVGRAIYDNFRTSFEAVKEMAVGFWQGLQAVFTGDFSFAAFKDALNSQLIGTLAEAGAKVKADVAAIFDTDWVGMAQSGVGDFFDTWREKAEGIANARLEAEKYGATLGNVSDALGEVSDASEISEKINKARASIESLKDSVADLNAQSQAAGQGGLAALLNIQDAQKARQMLLEFGEAAELGTTNLAALEKAAGATMAEIAAWLATQRELTESIGETVEQLNKLEKAPEVFADFVADLKLQNQELQYELTGRKALIPLLRAEAQLRERMGRELTSAERADLEQAIADQQRLNQAIADQEAAQEAAKKSAEMMQEPFKNALRGIQQSFTDTFRQILDGNIRSFKDMGSAVLNVFKQLAAEIATLLVFRPVVAGVLGGLGMGNLAQQLGLTAVSQVAGAVTGSQGSAGTTAGTAVAGTGGGFKLTDLFQLGGLLGNGSSGIGTMLFGAPAQAAIQGVHGQTIAAASPAVQGLFGSSGGGQFGSFLNTPLGGGIAAGLGSLAFSAIMNGGKISTGSLISAGLTGIGTALGGPIGGVIGGLLGSVIGGLFGKKPKWKKFKLQSGAKLGFDENGLLGVTDTYSITKRMDANTSIGEKLGNSASDAFNEFMASIGAEFDPSLTGDVRYLYRIKKKGKKTKGERHSWAAWFGGEHLGTTQNQDELMPIFLSGALAVASEQGKLAGLSLSTGTIFENLFNQNNRQGITDQNAIQEALDFGKFYDEVDRIRTPADAAAKALRELKAAMMGARADADAYGLSLDKIDQIFRNQFTDRIEDEILALKDPQALALREEEKAAAERIAVAQQLGVDLARVEELNALKRKEVLAQGLSGINSMMRDFFDELTLGDLSALSPGKQFEQARGRYQDVLASGNEADFIEAARDYLNIAKGYLGTTEAYAKIFADVIARVREMGDIPGFAAGGQHGGGWRLVGERGIELEATGPARYYNHQQTVAMLREAANTNAGFGRRLGLMAGQAGSAAASGAPMLRALHEIRDQQEAGLSNMAHSITNAIGTLTQETRRLRTAQELESQRRRHGGY